MARALADKFGKDKVFFDIATLEPGVDYAEAIERRLALANVLLIVIGPQWLTAVDENGQRRLDDPTDLVRLEVAGALKRNIPVIPVLVGGAAMPTVEKLPEELRHLARRHAYELSDRRWNHDLAELIEHFRKVISPGRLRFSRAPIIILVACLLMAILSAALYTFTGNPDKPTTSETVVGGPHPNFQR